MRLGTLELFVILIIVVIVFGPSQIPKLSKLLGKGIKGIRKGLTDVDDGNEES